MKLYQIDYLLAVDKYGSISRAADELQVSRPAVSRALRELEEEFGVTLFLRTTTGVLRTAAGQAVCEKCRKLAQLLTELQSEIAALKSGETGNGARQLHIGISYTARSTVSSHLADFRRAFPDVTLRLTDLEAPFIDSGRLLPDFDLEISLSEDRPYPGIGYLDVAESSFVFCCSDKHPLAGRRRVSLAELQELPLGGISQLEQNGGNQVAALFARHGLHPNLAYATQQVAVLQQMVRDGLCCCIQPLQSIACVPGVTVIPIDEAPKLRLRILWDESAPHSGAFYDFIGFMLRSLPRAQRAAKAREPRL